MSLISRDVNVAPFNGLETWQYCQRASIEFTLTARIVIFSFRLI